MLQEHRMNFPVQRLLTKCILDRNKARHSSSSSSSDSFFILNLCFRQRNFSCCRWASVKCKMPSFKEMTAASSGMRNDEKENYNVKESTRDINLDFFHRLESRLRSTSCLRSFCFLFNNLWWSVMTIMMSLRLGLWVKNTSLRGSSKKKALWPPVVASSKRFMQEIIPSWAPEAIYAGIERVIEIFSCPPVSISRKNKGNSLELF